MCTYTDIHLVQFGEFHSHGGTPLSLDGLEGKIPLTWMMTRGTAILGSLHIIVCISKTFQNTLYMNITCDIYRGHLPISGAAPSNAAWEACLWPPDARCKSLDLLKERKEHRKPGFLQYFLQINGFPVLVVLHLFYNHPPGYENMGYGDLTNLISGCVWDQTPISQWRSPIRHNANGMLHCVWFMFDG